jgi:hypothetical protein
MPLPVPILDDRTFDQLVAEGRSLIPRYTRLWTNHNVADPGIALLELFAFLTETAIFQIDQVPEESIELFVRLVGSCRLPGATVAAATAGALETLERPPRAVTAADLVRTAEELTREWPARVRRGELVTVEDEECPPGDAPFADATEAGYLTAVLDGLRADREETRERLFHRLKEYAPLATRLHVLEALYARIAVRTVVVRRPGTGLGTQEIREAIAAFFDPTAGGEDSRGWPFGRAVYRSELFQLLENMAAVDHVELLEVTAVSPEATTTAEGVEIPPLWLVDPTIDFDVTVRDA